MIKGVLFDMDGVLADSERFICEAAIMMFEELGIKTGPEDFKPFVGTGENRYLGNVAGKYGIGLDIEKAKAMTYDIYLRIIAGKLKPYPGAYDFVGYCRERGFKLALATSSDEVKMLASLNEIGIPPTAFDATINGLEVDRRKPFPDIYVKAAERIGLEPRQCLVIEDAVSGITAAKAAGCKCLALTTTFGNHALNEADWICDSLTNVPEEALSW